MKRKNNPVLWFILYLISYCCLVSAVCETETIDNDLNAPICDDCTPTLEEMTEEESLSVYNE